MKKLFCLMLLICLSSFSKILAQDVLWEAAYGEEGIEVAYSVCETADLGFILAGETWSNTEGMNDIYVVKTDSVGDMIWWRKYGGSERERAHTIHQTADGGFYVGGFTETYASGYIDMWLLRLNEYGDTLWTRTFGTSDAYERAYCGDLTSDGGYILAGNKSGTGEFYVVRVDSLGNELWTQTYKPTPSQYVYEAYGIQETDDGGFIIAGYGDSLYVVKTTSSGDIEWDRTYGEGDLCYDVDHADDGGFIVAGARPIEGYYHVFLMKIDAEGDTLWTNHWGRNLNSRGHTVEQADDGGYIVAGYTFAQAEWVDSVYVIKTDSMGSSEWEEVYGGSRDDQAWDLHQTSDGNYIIAGYTLSFGAGDDDFYLIKLSSEHVPLVSIDLIPDEDPVIVNPGGSFTYTGVLQNNTGFELNGDVWSMARLPGGFLLGPIWRFDNIPFAPYQNITVPGISQGVPSFAPPGTYDFIGYCGLFPSVVVDSSWFEVTVVEPGTEEPSPPNQWAGR
ncbi:MAG: hypothetical protein ACE5OP_10930 [Candidatus Glassbacteria bacterium]